MPLPVTGICSGAAGRRGSCDVDLVFLPVTNLCTTLFLRALLSSMFGVCQTDGAKRLGSISYPFVERESLILLMSVKGQKSFLLQSFQLQFRK